MRRVETGNVGRLNTNQKALAYLLKYIEGNLIIMKYLIIISILIFINTLTIAQNNLNLTDKAGLKQGKWEYYYIDTTIYCYVSIFPLDTTDPSWVRVSDREFYFNNNDTDTVIKQRIIMKGSFVNNKIHDQWRFYYNDGIQQDSLMSVFNFDNGIPVDSLVFYHRNGRKYGEGVLEPNNENVRLKLYFKNGKFNRYQFFKISEILDKFTHIDQIE